MSEKKLVKLLFRCSVDIIIILLIIIVSLPLYPKAQHPGSRGSGRTAVALVTVNGWQDSH